MWLKVLYRIKLHRRLNLSHPRRFTEKLQWLKLHDRNPMYPTLVDKYEVKEYISQILGEEYVIPTYGVWDHFDQVDFETLPEQFVLKCTHDSGNVWICKDKSSFDRNKAKKSLEKSLKHNFYWWTREWPYKNVKGKIIAEKYMESDSPEKGLSDYKFYCFNGEPKIVLVSSGRFVGQLCFDYYDEQWNKLSLVWDKPNSSIDRSKPDQFEEMKNICKVLSKDIPHVRIDLYHIRNRIYFGEFTFYDSAGFCHFTPDNWDVKIGDMIDIRM